MSAGDPQYKSVGQIGDVMTRGRTGWGPRSLSALLLALTFSVKDILFRIIGDLDPTKKLAFQVDTQATGLTTTIDIGAQTGSYSATLPILPSSSFFAMSASALTANTMPKGTTNGLLTNSSITDNGTTVTLTSSGGGSSTAAGALNITGGGVARDVLLNLGPTWTAAKFDSQGTAWSSRAIGAGIVFNQGSSDRPEVSWYRGARAYPELSIREHTSADTGGEVLAGPGTVQPTLCLTYITSGITLPATTGKNLASLSTDDATSVTVAAATFAGGVVINKTLISAKGRAGGVTATVTASGTQTLTIASTEYQTYTGSTAGQVIQFPAANLLGAGVAVLYTINNQSSVTVTPTRAGSDTFQGGGTTDPVLAGATQKYASDGVSKWLKV